MCGMPLSYPPNDFISACLGLKELRSPRPTGESHRPNKSEEVCRSRTFAFELYTSNNNKRRLPKPGWHNEASFRPTLKCWYAKTVTIYLLLTKAAQHEWRKETTTDTTTAAGNISPPNRKRPSMSFFTTALHTARYRSLRCSAPQKLYTRPSRLLLGLPKYEVHKEPKNASVQFLFEIGSCC